MILAAIVLGSAAVVVLLAIFAPEGWEDENGFHLGRQPSEHTRDDGAQLLAPSAPQVLSLHEQTNSRGEEHDHVG